VVTAADVAAECGGNLAVGDPTDVEVQHAIVAAPFQRIGRTVGARRKAAESQLAELAGQERKRLRHVDPDADNVRREPHDVADAARQRGGIRHIFGQDGDVGDDARLAGMDHVVARLMAAEHPALDQAHAAGAAHPGAAIMRQLDAVHQRPVQQQVAGIGEIVLVVEHDLADAAHHSTSRRMGRKWRVCRI
jgi:hypothetical protein